MNRLKNFIRITLDFLKGDVKPEDWLWLENVSDFFTAYIFPVFAFLSFFLLHLYFSEHVKLCQTSFIESFGILQEDCVTAVFFLRSIPRLPRTCYLCVFAIICCFMATSCAEGMASDSMQEALHMIRLEKEERIKEVKDYIEKVKEGFNSSRK